MSNPAVSFPGRACRFRPFADAAPLPALPEKKILLLPIGNAIIFFAFFARLESRRPRFLYRIKIGVAVLAVILRACSVMKFMRFDVAVIPADSRGKRLRQRKKKRKAQRGDTQQRGMPPQNKRHSHSSSPSDGGQFPQISTRIETVFPRPVPPAKLARLTTEERRPSHRPY